MNKFYGLSSMLNFKDKFQCYVLELKFKETY
jgi:hypothetical protein